MFIRFRRSKNSPATTQNSPDKFCLFPVRALPFQDNSPVTLQYSPATPILNENPGLGYFKNFKFFFLLLCNLSVPTQFGKDSPSVQCKF